MRKIIYILLVLIIVLLAGYVGYAKTVPFQACGGWKPLDCPRGLTCNPADSPEKTGIFDASGQCVPYYYYLFHPLEFF